MDDSGGDELVNFPQDVYEEVLKEFPTLGHADQEDLGRAIIHVIQRTHDLTQEVVVGRILEVLQDAWGGVGKRRPSKTVLEALRRKPTTLYREAVAAVQHQTLTVIAGLVANDEPDPTDPDDVVIGTAVGQA